MDMWTTGAGGEMPRKKAIREHRGRHVASRRCHDPTWPNGSCACGYCSQWPATFGYPHPAPSPASRALISSLRFPCPLRAHACSSSCCCLSAARSSQHRESSNGDGVVERAEELQRRGRAEPAGAFVQVRPLRAAVLRLRYHLRPCHHVRRVVPRPAPPRPPRRLLARGLRVRPPGPRHRAGELRAVQGVRDLPLPLGHALRAWCAGAGSAGAGQLGEGAGVGGAPRRASHLPGQPGAVGQPANHPGDRVLGHRLRGAAAHHGEGPGEEEVPRRRLRPARLLQGPRQVRGAQAQGDQERAASDAGVRGVLRAAVGVPRHRPTGEPGHAPRGPVAQQHRRHRHPQKYLRPLSGADRAREEIEELESMVFIHVSASIHWLITLPRWLCARTVRACRNCTTTSALRPATFVMCKAYEVATAGECIRMICINSLHDDGAMVEQVAF